MSQKKDIGTRIQVRKSISKHLEKKRNHYIKLNRRIDFPDDSDDCCSYIDDDEIEDYYNSLEDHYNSLEDNNIHFDEDVNNLSILFLEVDNSNTSVPFLEVDK